MLVAVCLVNHDFHFGSQTSGFTPILIWRRESGRILFDMTASAQRGAITFPVGHAYGHAGHDSVRAILAPHHNGILPQQALMTILLGNTIVLIPILLNSHTSAPIAAFPSQCSRELHTVGAVRISRLSCGVGRQS